MRASSIVPLLCAVAFAACNLPFSSPRANGIEVNLDGTELRISNRGNEPLYYAVFDAAFAARALWAPCVEPGCPSIEPGGVAIVGSAEVGGWGESDELLVYWWLRVPSPAGGYQPDTPRAIRMRY